MCLFIRVFSMACGSLRWRWEFPSRQRFYRLALQCGCCRWRFCGMNEEQESARNNLILGSIWREICSYQAERQLGETGVHPSGPVAAKARRKLLKRERLQVFQFDARMPSFRQARDWRKCETLWVF